MEIVFEVIHAVALVLTVLIIARAIMSWVNPSPYNALVQWVYRLTDPILGPIQAILPAPGGIDFSPLIAIVLIQLLEWLITNVLINVMY